MNDRRYMCVMKGRTDRDDWEACRQEWFDNRIDIETGRRELRMAIRKLKRTIYLEFFKMFRRNRKETENAN